jgi:hypothetical protein
VGDTLNERANTWTVQVRKIETEIAAIQAEIDELSFNYYGIEGPDRHPITERPSEPARIAEREDDIDEDIEDRTELASSHASTELVAELVSWAIGVAFGRYDVRLATGARPLPAEPEPFAALPLCSPGMLTGDDGLPLNFAPPGYAVAFPQNGILVDDPGHEDDLPAVVRAVLDAILKKNADAIWSEAGLFMDPQNNDLRTWIAAGFFTHHLKRHSKSRRKAPIIWQLAIPSGRYSIWLYAHRLTRDSFFQIQNEVVAPKLIHEERQLTSMMQGPGPNLTSKDRKAIAAQQGLVDELRAMLDEVKRVAPLWNPMLDDGVALTMAPLWRLVPQHKPWQKELKSKWDELVAGKYDWAQIAMNLWPERVVPKCKADRSLAVAHGLEDVFWVEGADGKWKPRPTPSRTEAELILERSSRAVKSALKVLLESPSRAPVSRSRRSEPEGAPMS